MKNKIVASARSFLGTRFHHQGRLKKTDSHRGGIDCLGLLIGVASELNLPFTEHDEINYPHYPDVNKLRYKLENILHKINRDDMQEGDILLLNIDGSPQHLAIVSELSGELAIIHAYAPARSVVEHVLDEWWKERIVAIYRIV